jgi:poly-gamma-glutamate capsule biosynthesis protein CapA/YwtB (metallophosphatase superfamily)
VCVILSGAKNPSESDRSARMRNFCEYLPLRKNWKGTRGLVRIAAGGDLMLGGKTIPILRKRGTSWPFRLIKNDFLKSDIRLTNLECTVSDQGKFNPFSGYSLRAPSWAMNALKELAINIVTLANNHIMDEGVGALQQTMRNLNKFDVQHFGAGENFAAAWKPAIMETNGLSIGFLGCVDFENTTYAAGTRKAGVADYRSGLLFKKVRELKSKVDYVVVNVHADWEFYPHPSPERVNYGRRLVEAGAKIVLMHHPHVPQGLEKWKDGVIVYSLGNFLFPADSYLIQGSPWTDRSYYVLIDLDEKGLQGVTIRPFRIMPHLQNVPLKGRERAKFFERLDDQERKLKDPDFIERYAQAVWLHQLWVYAHVANKTARERNNPRKVQAVSQFLIEKMLYPEKRRVFEQRMKKFGVPDLGLIDRDLWNNP